MGVRECGGKSRNCGSAEVGEVRIVKLNGPSFIKPFD